MGKMWCKEGTATNKSDQTQQLFAVATRRKQSPLYGNGFDRRFRARGSTRPGRSPTRGSAIRTNKALIDTAIADQDQTSKMVSL